MLSTSNLRKQQIDTTISKQIEKNWGKKKSNQEVLFFSSIGFDELLWRICVKCCIISTDAIITTWKWKQMIVKVRIDRKQTPVFWVTYKFLEQGVIKFTLCDIKIFRKVAYTKMYQFWYVYFRFFVIIFLHCQKCQYLKKLFLFTLDMKN